jgi:2,4-dienoyl-CoA reductase-like NADH-dependent reductase (Old Yellow Enzyme family)
MSDDEFAAKQDSYLEAVVQATAESERASEDGVFQQGDSFDPSPLFRPLSVKSLELANRLVMAPMTRNFSPGGVPGPDVAAYYRRRAEGGTGLIITEGTYVPHPGAGFSPNVPNFHGDAALAGWQHVVDEVHAAGGKIFPQLWHVGLMPLPGDDFDPKSATSPSGYYRGEELIGEPASEQTVEAVITAFGEAAASAKTLGFDGLQIHGAHGYLIDQFFWDVTNRRDGRFGGADLPARSNLALEIVRECRAKTGSDFPISFRFSQWKQQDFTARLAHTPAALEAFLAPLVDAGVDIFDCSTRRFWEPEFEGSDMNLAGWTRKLTGKVTSTVGSVSLNTDLFSGFTQETHIANNMNRLLEMMSRGDFDLVSVGRSIIVDPEWGNKVRRGHLDALRAYDATALGSLY